MKKITVLVFVCLVFFSFSAFSAIDDNASIFSSSEPIAEQDISLSGERPEISIYSFVIKTLSVLAVIIAVIYLFLRFVLKKAKFAGLSNNLIKITTTLPLSQNKMLSIVEVEGNFALIGITDNSITKIMDIDPLDIKGKTEDEIKKGKKFSDVLSGEINLNKAKEKLKGLKGLV